MSPLTAILLAGCLTFLIFRFGSIHDQPAVHSIGLVETISVLLQRYIPIGMTTPFWVYFIFLQVLVVGVLVRLMYTSRCRCPLCNPPFIPKYKVIKQLGEGSFARVLLVTRTTNDDNDNGTNNSKHRNKGNAALHFAVKQAVIDDITECNDAFVEMELLLRVEHPGLVKVEDQFFHKERSFFGKTLLYYCIVEEYCGAGDLFEMVQKAHKENDGLSEEQCLELFVQVLEGVEFMHTKNIIHRDIKPDNVLVTSSGDLKIADLGLGEKLRSKVVQGTYAGTEGYIAPEVWQGRAYGKACDVWSLGVLLYTMACWSDMLAVLKTAKLTKDSDKDCIEVIIRDPVHSIGVLLHEVERFPVIHHLLKQMLALRPKDRPTCTQLLQSDALKAYRHSRSKRRKSKKDSNFNPGQNNNH